MPRGRARSTSRAEERSWPRWHTHSVRAKACLTLTLRKLLRRSTRKPWSGGDLRSPWSEVSDTAGKASGECLGLGPHIEDNAGGGSVGMLFVRKSRDVD